MAQRLIDGAWLLDLGLVPPFAIDGYLVDDGDVAEMADSIRDLADRIPPFDVAAIAHDHPTVTAGGEDLPECAARSPETE